MNSAAPLLFQKLDEVRGMVLKRTMRVALLRSIFCNRALRLFMMFLGAVCFYLPLSLYFPVYVLLIGPVIYGLPHLAANFRFVPKLTKISNSKLFLNLSSLIFAAVAGWRIYSDFANIVDRSVSPELIAAGVTLLLLLIASRTRSIPKIIGTALFFSAVVATAWYTPVWFAASLVLIHNLVAFFYWIASTKNQNERTAAFSATFLFVTISAMMIFGKFDFVYQFMKPIGFVGFANLDYATVGRMIVPEGDPHFTVLFHCVTAYAFGQALHYFVWLKAIPDQLYEKQVPACFQKSYLNMIRDFGPVRSIACAGVCIAAVVSFFLIPSDMWRSLYFATASYHGFMEIAGLPLLSLKKIS